MGRRGPAPGQNRRTLARDDQFSERKPRPRPTILTIEDPIRNFCIRNKKSHHQSAGKSGHRHQNPSPVALRSAVAGRAPRTSSSVRGKFADRENHGGPAIALARKPGHLCIATLQRENNCAGKTLDRIIKHVPPRDQAQPDFSWDLSQYLRRDSVRSGPGGPPSPGMRVAASEVMVNTPHISGTHQKKGDVIGGQGSDSKPGHRAAGHAEASNSSLLQSRGARGRIRIGKKALSERGDSRTNLEAKIQTSG